MCRIVFAVLKNIIRVSFRSRNDVPLKAVVKRQQAFGTGDENKTVKAVVARHRTLTGGLEPPDDGVETTAAFSERECFTSVPFGGARAGPRTTELPFSDFHFLPDTGGPSQTAADGQRGGLEPLLPCRVRALRTQRWRSRPGRHNGDSNERETKKKKTEACEVDALVGGFPLAAERRLSWLSNVTSEAR